MRDFLNGTIHTGRHEGGFHTFFGRVLYILDRDYDCRPDAKWLDGQTARISRAHDFGESAEMCADMVAKFYAGHLEAQRIKRASDPMRGCIRVVRL